MDIIDDLKKLWVLSVPGFLLWRPGDGDGCVACSRGSHLGAACWWDEDSYCCSPISYTAADYTSAGAIERFWSDNLVYIWYGIYIG